MKPAFRVPNLWLYLPLAIACGFFLSVFALQHSNWYRQRLYRQLLSGNPEQRLKAASTLAHFGAQDQLLAGLKSEVPAVRDLARNALEYVWFRAAGRDAHEQVETAFQAEEKEDYQTSLALLDRVVEKYPKFAEGWNRRASVYWQIGQYDKSIADCQRALTLNPNHYGAWQGLGVCRVQLGDVTEACRCLRSALRIAPYDDATRRCLQKCEELLRVLPHGTRPRSSGDLI